MSLRGDEFRPKFLIIIKYNLYFTIYIMFNKL